MAITMHALSPSPSMIINLKHSTKPKTVRFHRSFLSLPFTSSHRHDQPVPAIHCSTLDSFSSPNPSKNDEKVGRKFAKAASSVVLVCALGVLGCCNWRMMVNPKAAIAGPKELFRKAPPVSMLISSPQIGGKRALNSFLGVSVKLTSNEEEEPSASRWPEYAVPPGPSMKDVEAIKMETIRKIKAGEPETAVDLLRNVYEECKNEPEPAYHIDMALVEILIYLGRYEDALDCKCLREEPLIQSDSRYQLYKAILYTMLDKEEAKKWWEEFAETIDVDEYDPSLYY